MILTSKTIDRMRLHTRIDERLEMLLLKRLGTEPYPHVYTEQDLHEQSRKMIATYNEDLADIGQEPDQAGRAETMKKTGGNCRKIHTNG